MTLLSDATFEKSSQTRSCAPLRCARHDRTMHRLLERVRIMTEKIDGHRRRPVDSGPEDRELGPVAVGLRGHERLNLVAPFKAAIDLVIRE